MAVVRLEVANPLNKETENISVRNSNYACLHFRTKIPMKLDYIFSIMDKVPVSMKRSLVDVPFAPQPAAQVEKEA